MTEPLRLVAALVEGGAVGAAQIAYRRGDEIVHAAFGCAAEDRFALASLTKPAIALACVEAVDLDTPCRSLVPEATCEATLRDLLAHQSGLPADSPEARRVQLDSAAGWPEVAAAYAAVEPVAAPRTRRIYSNAGYALAALMLERATGASYRDLAGVSFDGAGALEVREPGLLGHGEQLFNGARGALPGGVEGFMEWPVCDWAIGMELRDGKAPHWTGTALSPAAATHFGASGTLCLIDPTRDLRAVVLADRGTYSGWMLDPGGWPDICAALAA